MVEAYRFPVPAPLTPDALLHAAKRLAEASRSGYDISQAAVDGRFITVPAKSTHPSGDRGARADGYRKEIISLLRAEGPLKASVIARRLHLTSGQTPYLMGTLEQQRLVERLPGWKYRAVI